MCFYLVVTVVVGQRVRRGRRQKISHALGGFSCATTLTSHLPMGSYAKKNYLFILTHLFFPYHCHRGWRKLCNCCGDRQHAGGHLKFEFKFMYLAFIFRCLGLEAESMNQCECVKRLIHIFMGQRVTLLSDQIFCVVPFTE